MNSINSEGNKIICIIGPTAAGKTKLAIAIAKELGAEIISVDSRQMYRELKIGSAQPSKDELALVQHYFIADRSIHQSLSAGQFAEEARSLMELKLKSQRNIILAGGAGFYFRALFDGLDLLPDSTEEVRQEVNQMYEIGGHEALINFIADKDTEVLGRVDVKNQARLKRIAEVLLQSNGKKYSELIGNTQQPFIFRPIYLGIDLPRNELYQRINLRTMGMVEAGLKDEAQSLIHNRNIAALNTVGYKEFFKFFDGDYDEKFAIEQIKKNTRNYAKRQMTWFRNQTNATWFNTADPEPYLDYINTLSLG